MPREPDLSVLAGKTVQRAFQVSGEFPVEIEFRDGTVLRVHGVWLNTGGALTDVEIDDRVDGST